MLDDESPLAPFIIRAAILKDAVMQRGHVMTVSPSTHREKLLLECLPLFEDLKQLAMDKFPENAAYIISAVDEYRVAIVELAGLNGKQILDDRRDGNGACPGCGTKITKICPSPKYLPVEWLIVCDLCNRPYMAAVAKLESSEGFSTWVI